MKKYISLASALMLALGMGMTSCSNDINEVQAAAEQQPEMHKLYLNATVADAETRAYVEGVDGSDAIKITGWKDGDKLYGIYQIVTNDMGTIKNGKPDTVVFTFNGSTNKFESKETSVTKEQIKYFIHGDIASIGDSPKFNDRDGTLSVSAMFYFTEPFLTVDVEDNFSDLPMWGKASVNGEGELTVDMKMPSQLAFVCLHNTTNSPIEVKINLISGTNNYYVTGSRVQFTTSNCAFQYGLGAPDDIANAAVKTIPAKGKAYLPIQAASNKVWTEKVIVNGHEYASKDDNMFQSGKVYKLEYSDN